MEANRALKGLARITGALEDVYRDLHQHPELSMAEHRTAGVATDWLRRAGYQTTTGVGGTGVVAVLCSGDGPTVMLRADMDALPIKEESALDYASTATSVDPDGTETPVMHACGHDMHVTWLLGAATVLAQAPDAWRGTLLAVFQPAEETARGAQAMIDDGLLDRFPKPTVILGQHVMPSRLASSATAPAPPRPPPTASRSASSAAARTGRCPKPASILLSWPRPRSCGSRRSCPASSPPPRRPSSRSARCKLEPRRT